MWLALMTFSSAGGRRFVLPFPLILLWPFAFGVAVLTGALAVVSLSRRRWAIARCVAACLFHLGGTEVTAQSRDGSRFALRII